MLPDILKPGLVVVFVGTAKSEASTRAGHCYAHPQNMFWNLLRATGLAGEDLIDPGDDATVLDHGVGLTDLVPARAASSDSLLRSADFDVPAFLERLATFQPKVVAFNGGESARRVLRHLGRPVPPEGSIGWPVVESASTEASAARPLAYRLPYSSSANATGGYAAKLEKWIVFGDWVRHRANE